MVTGLLKRNESDTLAGARELLEDDLILATP